MGKALSDADLNHLLKFVGYGNLDANTWFVGMEEAGGGEDNIRTRLTFNNVEDCAHAHRKLGITKHHEGKRVIQKTWRGMCYTMLKLDGKPTDKETIRTYQAERLGSKQGSTLLCELMPIPKPNIGSWGYETFIPQFSSRKAYYEAVKPKRLAYIKTLLKQHAPKRVICYGKGFWRDYQELFTESNFVEEGPFKVARAEDRVIVLSPHFSSRAMNGLLDEIADLIKFMA